MKLLHQPPHPPEGEKLPHPCTWKDIIIGIINIIVIPIVIFHNIIVMELLYHTPPPPRVKSLPTPVPDFFFFN